MVDFIVVAILVVLVGSALAYIIRERKKGIKCVGCPAGGQCAACRHGADEGSSCGCGGQTGAGGCHTEKK